MVRLSEQDRTLWNRDQIGEGHALVRACLRRNRPGPFQIQAAIAAVHADAADRASAPTGRRSWRSTTSCYAVQPTAVVALNRAVAVGEQLGARRWASTCSSRSTSSASPSTSRSTPRAPTCSVAPDASAKRDGAYDRAIELTTNPTERAFLEARRAELVT